MFIEHYGNLITMMQWLITQCWSNEILCRGDVDWSMSRQRMALNFFFALAWPRTQDLLWVCSQQSEDVHDVDTVKLCYTRGPRFVRLLMA